MASLPAASLAAHAPAAPSGGVSSAATASRISVNMPQRFGHALLVILDASGSMKESVPGGIKSDLAPRGLLATMARMPAGTGVALRLLGEGPGEDECAASSMVVPFGPFDQARWSGELATIPWRGATPLTHTMRQGLEDLRSVDAARKEMLLISDGDETCGEDPVGVARAEADGIRIHTISLGEEVSHQLAGIALVTGGTYSMAFDETTFGEATAEAVPELEDLPSPPEAGLATGGAAGVLEVILDVSNSMWGQIDGRVKMELAREALAGALGDLPDSVPVGLRAYGHRVSFEDREAGCRDTELLLPPAPGSASAVIETAGGLTPRGQTPIAASLLAAADDLRAGDAGGTLLVISDGKESCDGDPVAVAEQLRASGLDVVIHTVGLGVDAEAAAALASLAEAGGGQYFDAPTADDLMTGVDDAVRTSREFVLSEQDVSSFPSPITRVQGGDTVETAQILEPGYYSFEEHLFREMRYFAVRGEPGERITLSGMVAALEIGRRRDGTVTYQGNPNMMAAERVDATGERLRGRSLLVRGEMGEWTEMEVEVADNGLARFRVGRSQGNVHRDMVFQVGPVDA